MYKLFYHYTIKLVDILVNMLFKCAKDTLCIKFFFFNFSFGPNATKGVVPSYNILFKIRGKMRATTIDYLTLPFADTKLDIFVVI